MDPQHGCGDVPYGRPGSASISCNHHNSAKHAPELGIIGHNTLHKKRQSKCLSLTWLLMRMASPCRQQTRDLLPLYYSIFEQVRSLECVKDIKGKGYGLCCNCKARQLHTERKIVKQLMFAPSACHPLQNANRAMTTVKTTCMHLCCLCFLLLHLPPDAHGLSMQTTNTRSASFVLQHL